MVEPVAMYLKHTERCCLCAAEAMYLKHTEICCLCAAEDFCSPAGTVGSYRGMCATYTALHTLRQCSSRLVTWHCCCNTRCMKTCCWLFFMTAVLRARRDHMWRVLMHAVHGQCVGEVCQLSTNCSLWVRPKPKYQPSVFKLPVYFNCEAEYCDIS